MSDATKTLGRLAGKLVSSSTNLVRYVSSGDADNSVQILSLLICQQVSMFCLDCNL